MQKIAGQNNTNKVKESTQKLNATFSDQAVQEQFWNIGFLKEL